MQRSGAFVCMRGVLKNFDYLGQLFHKQELSEKRRDKFGAGGRRTNLFRVDIY